MRSRIVACGAGLIFAAGCQTPQHTATDADAPVGVARPLDGWEDVKNVYQDGEFYFAGQPQESAWNRFASEGVVTVVNLRAPSEMANLGYDEPAIVESLGMRYVNIPVSPDTFSVGDVDKLDAVLSETSGPVLIHCGSSNRVGGVWAAYLARERGMDVETAIERGKAAGLHSEVMVEAARRVAGE